MPKKTDTKQKVYLFVCKNPGRNTYEISKSLRMSGGKVRYALYSLEKEGLIKFKIQRSSSRIKKLSYPVDAWKLLPSKIKRELKGLFLKRHK